MNRQEAIFVLFSAMEADGGCSSCATQVMEEAIRLIDFNWNSLIPIDSGEVPIPRGRTEAPSYVDRLREDAQSVLEEALKFA